jgi:hypothetical protein
MSEKFNSGYGGYTCDHYTCSKLLWVGWGGKDSPDRRIYCYESTAESVKEKGNYIGTGAADAGPTSSNAKARSDGGNENQVIISGTLNAVTGGSDQIVPIPPYVIYVSAASQVFRFGGQMIYSGTVTQYGSAQAVRIY